MSTVKKSLTEKQVKDQCFRWLKSHGWICRTIFTGGIPKRGGGFALNPCKGIPDAICFNTNYKIWIEFKRQTGGVLSIEQRFWHALLRAAGDTVLVIDEVKKLKQELVDKGMI